MNRYFIPPNVWSERLALGGEEAHHCVRVMRAKVGSKIEVFNGEGQSAICEIASAAKDCVELKQLEQMKTAKPTISIYLFQAIPKGKLMDWIVQKSVELGVRRITPLITAHTVVRFDESEAARKQDKWQRIALEACKQCGQNWLPIVDKPVALEQALVEASGVKIIASLAEEMQTFDQIFSSSETSEYSYLVGPEGDFSQEELGQAFGKGFQAVTLGDIVLRVETATMFGLSILRNAALNR